MPAPTAQTQDSAHPGRAILPGLALCLAVALAAHALCAGEVALLGKAWLEPLVLAIVLGTALRSLWHPAATWHPGIAFSGRWLLELAVVLLGASLGVQTLHAAGPALPLAVALMVAGAILAGFAIGRLLGLPVRLALLVACGNAICGNSAIAAIAPVIAAEDDDVVGAIAFTAVLGVAVVLGLPLVGHALAMMPRVYGAFAGLTVYAVPQVIAAAAPMGAAAVQTGTLVKLVRVLMLGPVCLALSLLAPRRACQAAPGPRLSHLVPWFILGFLAMAACRGAGLIPPAWLAPIAATANALTVVSMAALGLGVDVRSLAHAGGRVVLAALLSLAVLVALALIALAFLHFG